MKYSLSLLLLVLVCGARAQPVKYPVDPASLPHDGVPKGEVLKFRFDHSAIFPGTVRDYWIYIPAQYKADKPACVYVNQDGIQWKAPVVFDNLIASGEMPVTIGVFVTPGKVLSGDTAVALDRFNRSYEYDGLGDNYVRFLLEELLPDVERKTASNGRPLRLSKNGNDRAIGGSSSGAVCAFTAAWERPDAFSRVFSAIGTYVGLRGGDHYVTLVRKTEPRPIRVFLQDGSGDLNIYTGDWWMANQAMERALVFAGYEVNHAWGTEGHNGNQGTAVFPDAMRWLWKGWPQPVRNAATGNDMLSRLLVDSSSWKPVIVSKPVPARKALSPDRTQEYWISPTEKWVTVQAVKGASAQYRQHYGWLHVKDDRDVSGARSIVCDTAGTLFVATDMGIQLLDQTGKVHAIIPTPALALSCFFDPRSPSMLCVITPKGIYGRLLRTEGIFQHSPRRKPAPPKL